MGKTRTRSQRWKRKSSLNRQQMEQTIRKMKLRWMWMRQQMRALRRNLNLRTREMIRMMMTKKKIKKMMKNTIKMIKIMMIKRSLNQWIERDPDPGRAEDRVLVEGRVRASVHGRAVVQGHDEGR